MEELIEGNKLIAEFMGYQILYKKFQFRNWNSSDESYFETNNGNIVCDKNGTEVNLYPDGDPLNELSELPFDSSWNWLMPVIEKIKLMDNNPAEMFMGTTLDRAISFGNVLYCHVSTPINIMWNKIIEFIKWYNNEKILYNSKHN